jgi:hypothetical protein
VRPLLAHRPEAQKIIDTGLSAADKEQDAARKAFLLHEAIEGVRKHLKVAIGERKPDDKKPEDKKPDDKKPDDKKPVEPPKKPDDKKPEDVKKPEEKPPEPKKAEEKKPDGVAPAPMPKNPNAKADAPTASVSGKVTLAGKPLAEGEVTLVSLNQPLPRVFTAAVKNGDFKLAEAIPPGLYAGLVTGKGVPDKYHLVTTAGLRFTFAAGMNTADLVLK